MKKANVDATPHLLCARDGCVPFMMYIHVRKDVFAMKQFQYTITDPVGIHARPAGLLVKAIKALDSEVTIANKDGKSAAGTKLMAIMGLGIKQGDTVTISVDGGNEDANAQTLEQFFKDNL